MADNDWVFQLEQKIFTKIKTRASKKLKSNFPNAYFTIDNKSTANPKFPTIWIHELPGSELGADLEGKSINGILETIQVDVSSNTNQSDTKYVMSIVANEFKQLSFRVIAMPEFESTGDVYRSTARFRRAFGANDTF